MKRGFTLVEILVAVTIFVIVVSIASSLFVQTIRSQRRNLAYQELLDQTSYVMEYMARSIRMAKKADVACTGNPDYNYATTSWSLAWGDIKCLHFKNYKGECQYFCLNSTSTNSRLMTTTTPNLLGIPSQLDFTYLTSSDLNVSFFDINARGWEKGSLDNSQPLVIISLEIEGKEESSIEIQTSISQRNLDI
jgi:prepilin-type N-terminal cleavage/methylation domain-containing protein